MESSGWRVGLAALAVLAAAGCGGGASRLDAGQGDDVQPTFPVAVEAAALQGPGAALAGGVEVQEGSWLVGTVFPTSSSTGSTADGWRAVLVVDGDPVDVWNRYAAAFGIDDRADAIRSCVAMHVAPVRPVEVPTDTVLAEFEEGPPTRFLTEARVEGENRLRCEAALNGVSMELGYGASRTPSTGCHGGDPAGSVCPYAAESHLFIQAGETGEGGDFGEYESFGADELRFNRTWQAEAARGGSVDDIPSEDERIPIPPGPVVAPVFEVDTTQSRLPVVGERLDDGLDSFLRDGWVVPERGRSLVAPAQLIDCNSGLVAVLEVEGEPRAAVVQFGNADPDDDAPRITEGTDREGREWAEVYIGSAGGHHFKAIAVPASGGSSTVLVTECGD